MDTINLVVTRKVLRRSERIAERQIAYRDPSPGIASTLAAANANKPVTIRVGGFLELVVGDTGAVWRSHNSAQLESFDALFALLSCRPDVPMRCVCEVVRPGN